jgi:hypothetical protein
MSVLFLNQSEKRKWIVHNARMLTEINIGTACARNPTSVSCGMSIVSSAFKIPNMDIPERTKSTVSTTIKPMQNLMFIISVFLTHFHGLVYLLLDIFKTIPIAAKVTKRDVPP